MKTNTIATFVALIITVAQFATAQGSYLPPSSSTASHVDHVKTLQGQAKLAKEHNSPDDEAVFTAAVVIIENKSGSLTTNQRDRLVSCREKAVKSNYTEIAVAIDTALSLATITAAAPAPAASSEAPCNRILRSGAKCGELKGSHPLIQGIHLCPHDTCKECGKEIGGHSSTGDCPTTAVHDENQLAFSTVAVNKMATGSVVQAPPSPPAQKTARKSLATPAQKVPVPVPAHLAPKKP